MREPLGAGLSSDLTWVRAHACSNSSHSTHRLVHSPPLVLLSKVKIRSRAAPVVPLGRWGLLGALVLGGRGPAVHLLGGGGQGLALMLRQLRRALNHFVMRNRCVSVCLDG